MGLVPVDVGAFGQQRPYDLQVTAGSGADQRRTAAPLAYVGIVALAEKGFDDETLTKVEAALDSAFEIGFVFNKEILGQEFCKETLGLTDEQLGDWSFDIL